MDQNPPKGLKVSPVFIAIVGLMICASLLTIFLFFSLGFSIRPLWFGRRRTQQQGEEDEETPSMAHLIPVRRYAKDGETMGVNDEAVCSVCLGEFLEGEEVKILPKCKHSFHVLCIDMWLYSHSSCPLCRTDAIDIAIATATPPLQLLQQQLEIPQPPNIGV